MLNARASLTRLERTLMLISLHRNQVVAPTKLSSSRNFNLTPFSYLVFNRLTTTACHLMQLRFLKKYSQLSLFSWKYLLNAVNLYRRRTRWSSSMTHTPPPVTPRPRPSSGGSLSLGPTSLPYRRSAGQPLPIVKEVCRSAYTTCTLYRRTAGQPITPIKEDCRSAYTTRTRGLQVSLYHLYRRSAGQPIPPVQEV